MVNPLPLRPAPNHRETLPSFLARLAAMNGIGANDLALDMGFSLKRLIQFEDSAISLLAARGGISDTQLEELISWTGRPLGNVSKEFRGEAIGSRALWNPILRGCPICLREDAETGQERPLQRMTMRGDWQLRECSMCVRHRHKLVQLWECGRPVERYDYSNRLTELLPRILDGTLEQQPIAPTPYDLWLDARVATGHDPTWLSGQSLYAATTFCRLLGEELLRLRSPAEKMENGKRRSVQALGFEVASCGPSAIREAFFELADTATGKGDEPKKAFGKLYVSLNRAYINLEAFAPYRDILRSCIIEIWPVAEGQEVLGIPMGERKLHSVVTASREFGVSTCLLAQFLTDAGAISKGDDRPNSRKTFDAAEYVDLITEIPVLVGPNEMCTALGATRKQFKSLASDGVLVPRIKIATVKAPWRLEDALTLLEELNGLAVPVSKKDFRWESLQRARQRSGISVGDILKAIRSGHIKLGQFDTISGYAGFCVNKSEIDRLPQVDRKIAENPLITAGSFGRQIGIRTKGTMQRLVLDGHASATIERHPTSGRATIYFGEDDIEAFHARFMTLTTMVAESGHPRQTLLSRLRAAEVQPFCPDGVDLGGLYLRSQVEPLLEA